ncbi:hypothetical protein Btru_034644 [Bulinus truncatus]|nr:hypothetical protein Btru_034644 [Bulinus truncatus]
MWSFAMALFLASIPTDSMRISATYGLSRGAAVLLLGAVIGDWVDRTARLRAAKLTMIGQNVLVIGSSLIILTLHVVQHQTDNLETWLRYLVYSAIIILSVSSRLMKEGRIIVMERDWIAEMCQKDEHSLAVMTSSFRRIDLATKLLAPIVTGHTMSFAGTLVGCTAISVWSLLSLGAEYYLITRAYNIVPSLKRKKHFDKSYLENSMSKTMNEECDQLQETNEKSLQTSEVNNEITKSEKSPCCLKVFASFIAMYKGFRKYFSYDVMYAGLALAFLYLTVLGFDEITINYATEQHLDESVLGLLMGAGACFGIIATFTYPFIVKRLGLPGTGVLGLSLQVSSLCLCIVSLWLPGSPFDLFYTQNVTHVSSTLDTHNMTQSSAWVQPITSLSPLVNVSGLKGAHPDMFTNTTNVPNVSAPEQIPSVSIWVMMAGVVLARFGLWTADLTIIQLFLEKVSPTERGVVNGFQDSLNQLMDFLKYGLVHILPHTHQFGLLVIISVLFIMIAWTLMLIYAVKARWRTELIGDDENINENKFTSHVVEMKSLSN